MMRVNSILVTCLLILLSPASWSEGIVPNPMITAIAYDAGSKQHPFVASSLNLAAYGYVEDEFTMEGTANTYKKDGRWLSDGKWATQVDDAELPFGTRILVRRPLNSQDFNGIVIVEWMNNTAFMDVDVIWAQSHKELLREGYAWVGLSAQAFGVAALKGWDRERYGELRLSNDGLSYDIFSQAAQAVRSQSHKLLGGFPVAAVIGVGESQSAIRLTTYVNAFQDAASQVYDAVLLYSRFSLSAPLKNGISLLSPTRAFIREDSAIKVLQLETEQDVFMFLFRLVRQDDNENLRTWEIPGASHYDDYGVSNLLPQYRRDWPQLADIELVCKNSLNKVPQHYVVNAALSGLSRWVTHGEAPPHSPRIEYRNLKVVRDEHGNAVGGIRLPEMEVPTAKHNYANYGVIGTGNGLVNAFACPFLGNTVPFGEEKLKVLYPTHEDYVSEYTAAANAALETGFLLQADYEEAVANAQAAEVP